MSLLQRISSAISIAAFALSAHAAVAQDQNESTDPRQALGELQSQMQQVGKQLQAIQEKALDADPALEKQAEEYNELVASTMNELGTDVDAVQSRLQEIADQAKQQAQTMSKEQMASLKQEYQQKRQQLNQVQQQAMQNEDVQQAASDLNDAVQEGMNAIDDNSEELFAELQSLREEYQSLMQEFVKQQQQKQKQDS
ncbi:hypothetical protein [Bermanella sp. R86510]|uniref:hypothetical protein n=1 Tax=unclassified Bermanella TaxID=2627862 RepID=UPI0037CBEB83